MASYRIHRLKEHLQQPFRSAAHVSGAANVKPRDYEPGPQLEGMLQVIEVEACEAPTPYAAYFLLRDGGSPLLPGDLLENTADGSLRIFKYVGFEPAQWVFPEAKPDFRTAPNTGQMQGEQMQAVPGTVQPS